MGDLAPPGQPLGFEPVVTPDVSLMPPPPKPALTVLFHYTNEDGLNGILSSGQLHPSLKTFNPNDVRYGNGQYVSDYVPGTKTSEQLSREFIGNPFQAKKYSHYIAIDVQGLNVQKGRDGVYVIPNEQPLDLSNRVLGHGKN